MGHTGGVTEGARAVRRTLALLGAVADRGGASAKELAEELDLPLPTVYRLAGSLVDLDYLVHIKGAARYELGYKLHGLGVSLHRQIGLSAQVRREIVSLHQQTGYAAYLSVRRGTSLALAGARIDVTIQADSIDTKSADRDGHLRSGDFFDVEKYPTIRFASTEVTSPDADTLRVAGDLTIKDVTKPVVIDFEFEGSALDPFGNERVGLSGKVDVNRKDFGLTWNAALETGGVLVSENVTLVFEVSAIKQADADAAAEPVAEEAPVAEPVAETAKVTDPLAGGAQRTQQGGFVGWLKGLFSR